MFAIFKTNQKNEIKFYSHSLIFYFWPIWLVGLLLGSLSHFGVSSPLFGNIFLLTILLVIFITTVNLRGLWFFMVLLLFIVFIFAGYIIGFLSGIVSFISSININLSVNSYFMFSVPLFVVWFMTVLVYDRLKYVVVRKNRVTLVREIGERVSEGSDINMSYYKVRDNFAMHWLLGFGSGDLIIRINNEQIRMPNILNIKKKLQQIEAILNS